MWPYLLFWLFENTVMVLRLYFDNDKLKRQKV